MLGYAATTNFALTLASLATGSARESTAISALVGGTGYDDYMLQLNLGISTPTSAADKAVYVWFYGSADGTNYTEPATGSNAAITIGTNHNLKGPFTVAINVGTLQYDICIGSVAQFFGGILPKKWGIVIENQANGSLSGTEFNQWLTPVFYTT
jgi:hypothetical protein